jgi:dTDP-4-amino-4,6-dideoxygalactose transaminase
MGETGAAMGVVQMERLPGFLDHREHIFGLLEEGLAGVPALDLVQSNHQGDRRASHYCLVARLADAAADREAVIEQLKAAGVGTSVYYPKALPDTAYYAQKYGYAPGSCPNATRISTRSLAFPCAPHVTEADAERIVQTVKETLV